MESGSLQPWSDRGLISLPDTVFDIIANQVSWDTLPAVRLCCKSFAACPSVTRRVTSVHIVSWKQPHQHNVTSRLQHVKHMHAVVSNQTDWLHMQQLAQQLPHLESIQLTGRRSWYKMSYGDLTAMPAQAGNESTSIQYSKSSSVCAVSFEGTVRGLEDIAELAPQLKQLQCSRLMLPKQTEGVVPLSLANVTHFGSTCVHIEAEDAAEAAETFATAFPSLQVLFQTPEFGRNLTIGDHIHKTKVPLRHVLSSCKTVHSVRVFGSTTSMCGFIAQQLQGLTHINRLSVYGIGPVAELKGIEQLTHLKQLRLSFQLPAKRAAAQLLTELTWLSRLQLLALPAKLLCAHCCSSVQQAVTNLVQSCSSRGCHMVFLARPARPGSRRQQSGDYCPHNQAVQEQFSNLLIRAAAGSQHTVGRTAQPTVVAGHETAGHHQTVAPAADVHGQSSHDKVQQLQLCSLQQEEWQQLPCYSAEVVEVTCRGCPAATWDICASVTEWQ